VNLWVRLKRWWLAKKLRLANKWAKQAGLYLAKIERRAGTGYILDNQERWRRIGQ
jgi:hypothetical protein